MSLIPWRVCALAALLPLSAAVHAAPAVSADPMNPAASVPAIQYDSAFKTYQPSVDESVSPDKMWRAANAGVAAKPGEDRMVGMQMGGSMDMPSSTGTAESKPAGKAMVMPDGSIMPMGEHQSKPMYEGMKIPSEKGVKAPPEKGMKMPGGSSMPMDKDMTMPMPKDHKSMPGMDLPPEHDGKGH